MDAKLLRHLESFRLVSCMNRTKWKALVTAMRSSKTWRPDVRYKQVGGHTTTVFSPFDWEAARDGSYCEHIEWMSLDTIENRGRLADPGDHKPALVALLTSLKIPFRDEGRHLVIFGYIDGSQPPPDTAR